MSLFVDTSAIYAYFDGRDQTHNAVRFLWDELLDTDERLYTTNYVLTESVALLQRRLGSQWVQAFQSLMAPEFEVIWIDEERHSRALAAVLSAGRRQLSLVDCVSFDTMRQLGLTRAFAVDGHFQEAGFIQLPERMPPET